MSREPYAPTKSEWRELLSMLCEHCVRWPACDIIDGMIEMKDGGDWPAGGWVTDPGAETTCLSYSPRLPQKLSRPVLKRALSSACDMCDGCAARKGSEASVTLHTQRDFSGAVNNRSVFFCHKPENRLKPCGGWANAVLSKKHKRHAADYLEEPAP